MEFSEIIELVPDLTKEEIDHLRSALQDYGLINVRESNLGNPNVEPGVESIKFDTYDPLVLARRMMIESEMKENNDSLKDFLGLSSNVSAFGYKYVVVTAYWISKKRIGKLTNCNHTKRNSIPGILGYFQKLLCKQARRKLLLCGNRRNGKKLHCIAERRKAQIGRASCRERV